MINFGIIGAGAWGIALAINLQKNGHNIKLWHHNPQKASDLEKTRTSNSLRDILIDDSIHFSSDLDDVAASDILIYASPTQEFDNISGRIQKNKDKKIPFIIASKGIDTRKNLLLHEISKINLPNWIPMVLSGPGFAIDIANGKPTALTLACEKKEVLLDVGELLANNNFRPYFSEDIIGTQIGGAIKNIIAISTGIAMGKDLGDGSVASLISRGMNEIILFGECLGAKKETFIGLSGLGDLVLTASNLKSRNTQLGYDIGKNGSVDIKIDYLTEGYHTAKAVYNIAKSKNINLPLIEAIYNILYNKYNVDEAIGLLMNRPLKEEI